jgi:hypothetical protein
VNDFDINSSDFIIHLCDVIMTCARYSTV